MATSNVPSYVNQDIINLYESAGINPAAVYNGKTVNAVKKNSKRIDLKEEIKKQLRILDEQDAVNRYEWYNLPNGITGQFVEWLLYYYGQITIFYDEYTDKFYMLPYALNGEIDVYGRFKRIAPIPLANQSAEKPLTAWSRDVVYDIEDIDENTYTGGCVILRDYTHQRSQTSIARQIINDPILDIMAEAFPMARTSLIASSGVRGMRVPDEDSASNVAAASDSMTRASIDGKPLIPIVGPVEFQDLTNQPGNSSEYLQYMQALDNFRLSLYGLKNGGVFEKDSAYVNNIQASNTQNNVGLVYMDGLKIRQTFCDLVNAIWGLGIWCDASPEVIGMNPMTQDNEMYDDEEGGVGSEDNNEGGNEDVS